MMSREPDLNDRPFNSTHRCHLSVSSTAGSGGFLYARSSLMPRQDKIGGMTGKELHDAANKSNLNREDANRSS